MARHKKRSNKLILLASVCLLVILTSLSIWYYNSSLGKKPQTDDQAIRKEFYTIRKDAEASLAKYNERDKIDSVDIENDWAVLEYSAEDIKTGKPVPAEPALMIFHKENGQWRGASYGPLFNSWLEQIPDNLISPDVKKHFLNP